MYSTHIDAAIKSMGRDHRQWNPEWGLTAGRRRRLVSIQRSTPAMPERSTATAPRIGRARTEARRRWFWRQDHDATGTGTAAATTTDLAVARADRAPASVDSTRWAAAGQRIAERGLAGSARDVRDMVVAARRCGAAPVAVGILADADAPEPARLRAFAVVASALLRFEAASAAMTPLDAA